MAPWSTLGPWGDNAGIKCHKSRLFDTSLVHPGLTLGPQSESKSIPKRAFGRNLRQKRRFVFLQFWLPLLFVVHCLRILHVFQLKIR